MSTDHVPAWKRLGLKLKYANEDSPTIESGTSYVNGSSQKRKESPGLDSSESPLPSAKKARHNERPIKLTTSANVKPTESTPQAATTPRPKPLARKKSVSFSVDTKEVDGDTAQNVPISVPGSPGSTPKKPKKEKKWKADRQLSTTARLPKKSTDALDYLNQHFHDRSSWKFNKNREIWILKHVLSTETIPSEYNAQLAGYIHGLKSTGARERMTKDCQQALSNTAPEPDDKDFHPRFTKDLEHDSLQQSSEEDTTYSSWIKNKDRPILILLSLGQPTRITANGIPQTNGTRVKKSKARTSRIEIESDSDSESDSSSSDSDSDSDSDTDGDRGEGGTPRRTYPNDETSSSGSSDSDSSESDDGTSSSGSSSESDAETEPRTNGVAHSSDSGGDSDSDAESEIH